MNTNDRSIARAIHRPKYAREADEIRNSILLFFQETSLEPLDFLQKPWDLIFIANLTSFNVPSYVVELEVKSVLKELCNDCA